MQRGEICNPEYANNNNDKQFKYQQSLIKTLNCQKGENLMYEERSKTSPTQIRGGEQGPNATRQILREKKTNPKSPKGPSDVPNRC